MSRSQDAVTPSEMFRLMKEDHARVHDAVRRNLVLPAGLPPEEKCRIEIVQAPGGAVLATKVLECGVKSFERAVLQAVARTSLPPPLQFPQDPPLARLTSVLEFSARDASASSAPFMQPAGRDRPATD